MTNSFVGITNLDIFPLTVSGSLPAKASFPSVFCPARNPFAQHANMAKMTKRPWRVKRENKKNAKIATRPGQIISVDHLESNTPGLIAQLKASSRNKDTNIQRCSSTSFQVIPFVYLQKRLTSEETVMAKHAFERSADQRGVKIIHYQADNGRFDDNAFIADCKEQRQGLSYCGVNAHFQNGIAERRIRNLQEQTRTSMLYTMNKWKHVILICLWPYAMHHANDVANATPRKGEEQSPLELFLGVNITPKLRHFHAFGYPTYILDNALQSGQVSPKWKRRSRLGVYLGPSTSHARSVALVINPRTGHVSPQFHVKFDNFFETVQDKSTNMDAPEPEWKYLSGFAVKKGPTEPPGREITDRLIVPRRGPMTMNNSSVTQGTVAPPAEPPEESAIPDAHEASE